MIFLFLHAALRFMAFHRLPISYKNRLWTLDLQVLLARITINQWVVRDIPLREYANCICSPCTPCTHNVYIYISPIFSTTLSWLVAYYNAPCEKGHWDDSLMPEYRYIFAGVLLTRHCMFGSLFKIRNTGCGRSRRPHPPPHPPTPPLHPLWPRRIIKGSLAAAARS